MQEKRKLIEIIKQKIYNLEDLKELSIVLEQIIFNKPQFIIYFYGEMGVGKTTLIQYLLKGHIGVGDINNHVTSPTFNILNLYEGKNGSKYLHFDLYRKDVMLMEDLREMGMELLYDGQNYCFIEWPERIINREKSTNIIEIFIKKIDDFREITVNV